MRRPPPPPGPYLVAGLGRAGRAATDALLELVGPGAIRAWDAAVTPAAAEVEALGVDVHVGGDGRELLGGIGAVIRSPGIAIDAPLLEAARRQGVGVIDELELGWRLDPRPFVAVTGTNGKSTVVAFVAAALRAAGRRPVVAGNTQVGPPVSAAGRDADVVVAEVSSFQLEACPALAADAAAFTNLTEDHLDRHRTMARYERCKRRLFERAPAAALNVDDPAGRRLARDLRAAGAHVAAVGREADYRIAGCRLETPDGPVPLAPPAPGAHNTANAALAVALAGLCGVAPERAADAIARTAPPPGRFERVDAGQPFVAVVDFAHNADGIRCALAAARELAAAGRVLAVIGAIEAVTTPEQRRAMGEAASAADDVIVTSDPVWGGDAVASELADGAGECALIGDRAAAIEAAARRAEVGDVVIVLGRGMRVRLADGGRFDDREALRGALSGLRPC